MRTTASIINRKRLFQNLAGVAASRQSAAFFARDTEAGGALPRRRYGVLKEARKSSVSSAAFSLVEIMVVVGLLSVIIIGLLSMFTQTQRAFRLGMTQVDVLEAGRAATDMIARELEQVAPAYQPVPIFYSGSTFNPARVLDPADLAAPNLYLDVPAYSPLLQPLPGGNYPRMNLVEDVFFMYRQNQDWYAVGYFVRVNGATPGSLAVSPVGVGTLYRFATNVNVTMNPQYAFPAMFNAFNVARAAGAPAYGTNGLARVMDGVINFRVRVFDTNSFSLGSPMTWSTNANHTLLPSNGPASLPLIASPPAGAGIVFSPVSVVPDAVQLYLFTSNAVPVAVELEIGILEQRALDRFKALTDPGAQRYYLTNQAANVVGRVHLFRQRVPIRAADLTAYQ